MNDLQSRRQLADTGVAVLALCGPRLVGCIQAAMSEYGSDLPFVTERFQVENHYMDNALDRYVPIAMDMDTKVDILRTLSVVMIDALTERWTETEWRDMLSEVLGVDADSSAELTNKIVTDDDWALIRWIKSGYLDLFMVDELLALGLKKVDDAVDELMDNKNDNLYEMARAGRVIKELAIQGKLNAFQILAEKKLMAKNDFGDKGQIDQALAPYIGTLPDDTMSIGQMTKALMSLKAIGAAASTGLAEMDDQGDPTEAFIAAQDPEHLDHEVNEALGAIVEALSDRTTETLNLSEQGGLVGDLFSIGAKLGKKAVSAIKNRRMRKAKSVAKPLIEAAGGVAGIDKKVRELATKRKIPVTQKTAKQIIRETAKRSPRAKDVPFNLSIVINNE